MRSYILKLRGSTRYLNLQDSLVKESWSVFPVDAIPVPDPEFVFAKSAFNYRATYAKLGYRLSENAVSCFLGHRKIYQEFLDSGDLWSLILEDDVQLVGQFDDVINQIVSTAISNEPTIVQLFTRGERFVERNPKFKFDNHSLFRFRTLPGQTAAYLINRSAAQCAISDNSGIGPADWPNWATQVNFYCVYPFVFFESGTDSQIPIPTMARCAHWKRLLSIFFGVHWIANRHHFQSFRQYKLIVLRPIWMRFLWKIKSSLFSRSGAREDLWAL
jgi:hypothetical protein